ncbi:MAG TPA: 5-methyltetrahydropteroyltriglutamate--homocysteine S-methyltransferase, partial [Acidimicrobiales bacterium]|nr:5-methyltetrahydropteroyltriglutamate--homocysteine S-methyltransferase [Acidimicrobiales bacterium]
MARIGARRELKRVLESYWKGTLDEVAMREAARERRRENWGRQARAGISGIPSNDFSLYDHVLDMCCLVGAIPERAGVIGDGQAMTTYFAMARGASRPSGQVHPLEMTKWFDTNYHYLVPELGPDSAFALSSSKPVEEYLEARALGIDTRPVLVGPVSFLLLAKSTVDGFSPLDLLARLIPVYREALVALRNVGATWVQFDEPLLVTDLSAESVEAFHTAYTELCSVTGLKTLITSYFGALGENVSLVTDLPVDAVHVDASHGRVELTEVADRLRPGVVLSAGVVDGRNVWRSDLRAILDDLEPLRDRLGPDRLWVAPSCSLLHVPVDLDSEPSAVVDDELRSWLAFGAQKLDELSVLARGLTDGRGAIEVELSASDRAALSRSTSARVHNNEVRRRTASLRAHDAHRESTYAERMAKRTGTVGRPLLPTTTIGSFPQTSEIRRNRRDFIAGTIGEAEYRKNCESYIEHAVRAQDALGLDVLVHGEAERDDMVQYFSEHLSGFLSTEYGWVQSYGTRCVRPPILYGDVDRPTPITPSWIEFAQGLTDRPIKGMLTGPVTMMKWSFVRDDQALSETCRQL